MREGCNPDLTAAHGVPGEGQQLAVQGEASPVLLHLSPGSAPFQPTGFLTPLFPLFSL